jgi:hypothetical protein
MDNINTGKHFLLIPRTDDCIAILLGSYQPYLREMKKEPGTYDLSKGWLEAGTNPLAESRKYEEKYGAETAAVQMDSHYHHYPRLMIVARRAGTGNLPTRGARSCRLLGPLGYALRRNTLYGRLSTAAGRNCRRSSASRG